MSTGESEDDETSSNSNDDVDPSVSSLDFRQKENLRARMLILTVLSMSRGTYKYSEKALSEDTIQTIDPLMLGLKTTQSIPSKGSFAAIGESKSLKSSLVMLD